MLDLPRQRLHRRARHGLWSTFAVDPTAFYEKFGPTVDRKSGLSESQTSRVVDTLHGWVVRLDDPRRRTAERLALYRAFYTAADELADIADDSYGHLGDLRTEMWLVYLDIDWRETGMSADDYWRDLCGLRMWEDYGTDLGHEQAWFCSVQQDEITLIEGILSDLAEETVHTFWTPGRPGARRDGATSRSSCRIPRHPVDVPGESDSRADPTRPNMRSVPDPGATSPLVGTPSSTAVERSERRIDEWSFGLRVLAVLVEPVLLGSFNPPIGSAAWRVANDEHPSAAIVHPFTEAVTGFDAMRALPATMTLVAFDHLLGSSAEVRAPLDLHRRGGMLKHLFVDCLEAS